MPHQDLVILIPIWALHGPSDSGPHLGIIGTWILYSTPGPHFHPAPGPTLGLKLNWLLWFPLWASPLHGESGPPWASLGPGESGPYLLLTRNC